MYAESESGTSTPKNFKNTPIKSGSISKSLLTPCRRVGLSRKKSCTPNQETKKHVSTTQFTKEEYSNNVIDTRDYLSKKCKEKRTTIIEKDCSSNLDEIKPIIINNQMTPENKENKPRTKHTIDSHKIKTKKKSVHTANIYTNCVVNLANCNTPPSITDKSKISKRLSMDITNSEENDKATNSNLKESEINKNSSNTLSSSSLERIVISKKRKNISSDEEGLLSSQYSLNSHSKSDSIQKNNIKEIKQQIKMKVSLLDNLKQASIYKKLYDTEELKKLTTIWKEGCKKALEDILEMLKQRERIDMKTLLNNLKIPSNLIEYDVETDSLI